MARESGILKAVFSTKEIEGLDVDNFIVSEQIMKNISCTKSPQGVLCVCEYKKEKKVSSNKILLLDNVSDPGNLGTLLRTALAFGYNDVILNGGCSQYNEKALQSSQGAIFKLNIINNLDFKNLNNYSILATEIKGSVDLKTVKIPEKFVLVLGNEAHGVSKEILDLADQRIRIEIKDIESLNVAVAGAIAMYSLLR